MSGDALRELAEASGIVPHWRDVHGQWHDVGADTLRAVLAATGVDASSDALVEAALHAHHAGRENLPPLITATQGEPVPMQGAWQVALESGDTVLGDGPIRIDLPGYHTLSSTRGTATMCVAPRSCPNVPADRPWGVAVQLYSLRRDGDGGIGDFSALAGFATAAAGHGADAVAISPVHAQFSADVNRFSPYAPSSRIMLNVLHADPGGADPTLEALPLVDWPDAARARLAKLRVLFDATDGANDGALATFRAEGGQALERHARFEALHAHFYGSDPALWSWRNWPEPFRDPASPEVERFAAEHAGTVAFHAWLQMRADTGLSRAQAAAKAAGMRIGLISDLAVGTDGGGSHAWSLQDETMIGLSIGAPPDLLNQQGQNWGIAAFSPLGLRRHGFGAFIGMLRAALRHAGGVRIDHVMGLQRLWVVPDGFGAHDGAYLSFPVADMMRIVALEAHRHGAVVLGEDLGTVPDGFQERLIDTGLLGLRVLWFERDDNRFHAPSEWSKQAVAMTSTHDLATLAGWWRGHDIEWRARMGWEPDVAGAQATRARERELLWSAMRDSGAADGEAPPPDDTWRACDAALRHVAKAACDFVLLPVEDVLARDEQPNLPGTTNEHPNWRRRLDGPADQLLEAPEVEARLAAFRTARRT